MLMQSSGAPDILEVIADLSNDEVFTPPKVANAVLDLLPAELWADSSLRFLDLGSKTGVFLREIAKRLMVGLADEIEEEQARLEHILRNQVFGIAITELTALISRRTVYCSKTANGDKSIVQMPTEAGNVWFDRVEHLYVKGRCAECSASEREMEQDGRDNHAYALIHAAGRHALREEFDMKFDVIVGNPPYQMSGGGGGTNDTPLYDLFVDQAKELDPRFITMVIPSRWMAGGRGLDGFRARMLADQRLKTIVDYPNSAELFPTVDLKSGICYFLWDRDHAGPCDVTLVRGDTVIGPDARQLGEFDVLVRDQRAVTILRKVLAFDEPSMEETMTGDTPFGLASNFKDYEMNEAARAGEVLIHASRNGKRHVGSMPRKVITKNEQLIDVWKVLLPKAGPGNSGGHVLPDMVLGRPLVAGPGSVCTQTYIVAGPFQSELEAQRAAAYLTTSFLRFLVSLRKISQDALRSVYRWVPQQTWEQDWTDQELFTKYDITDEEQAYIAKMIREMPT